jgi:hypothetical protein
VLNKSICSGGSSWFSGKLQTIQKTVFLLQLYVLSLQGFSLKLRIHGKKKKGNWHLGHTFTSVKRLFIWIKACIILVWRIGKLNIKRTKSLSLRNIFCWQCSLSTPISYDIVPNWSPFIFDFALVHL